MWRVVVRRECEEKTGVSIEMFDSQRHDVRWTNGMRSRAIVVRVATLSHLIPSNIRI